MQSICSSSFYDGGLSLQGALQVLDSFSPVPVINVKSLWFPIDLDATHLTRGPGLPRLLQILSGYTVSHGCLLVNPNALTLPPCYSGAPYPLTPSLITTLWAWKVGLALEGYPNVAIFPSSPLWLNPTLSHFYMLPELSI